MKTKAIFQIAGVGLFTALLSACSPQSESSSKAGNDTQVAVQGEPIKPIGKAEPAAGVAVQGEPIKPLIAAEPVEDVKPIAPLTEAATPIAKADGTTALTATTPAAGEVGGKLETVVEPATRVDTNQVLAAAVIQADGRDYLSVGFDQLAAFDFEMTDDLLEAKGDAKELTDKTNGQIPTRLRDLNLKSVAVKGYMLPLKVVEGAVTEFLLMRDQSMCCFGTVPKINEWVSVKTIGKGVKPVMDEPVTIFGKLHVGEMRENGYLVGIYRMDGEKLAGPLDL